MGYIYGFSARSGISLTEDALQVKLHCFDTYIKGTSNFWISKAICHVLKNFCFSVGENRFRFRIMHEFFKFSRDIFCDPNRASGMSLLKAFSQGHNRFF